MVNPLEAMDILSQEEEKTAFLVNTMVFYRCPANLLEVYAARLKECTEKREVVFFLPLSISDYSAAALRQILTTFRRQVIILGSDCLYLNLRNVYFLQICGNLELTHVSKNVFILFLFIGCSNNRNDGMVKKSFFIFTYGVW